MAPGTQSATMIGDTEHYLDYSMLHNYSTHSASEAHGTSGTATTTILQEYHNQSLGLCHHGHYRNQQRCNK